jgi:hypothetical protein
MYAMSTYNMLPLSVIRRQNGKYYNGQAFRITMLGYPDTYRDKDRLNTIVRVKNSYVVWDVTQGRRQRELNTA